MLDGYSLPSSTRKQNLIQGLRGPGNDHVVCSGYSGCARIAALVEHGNTRKRFAKKTLASCIYRGRQIILLDQPYKVCALQQDPRAIAFLIGLPA